jgi:signal peptidase I
VADPALSEPRPGDAPPSPAAVPSPAAPPTRPVEPDGPQGREGRGTRAAVEWLVIIAATVLVTLLIKTFLIQAFYIPTGSMEPTLMPHDRVLVNKVSYDIHAVHRGDIIVFKKPPTDNSPGVTDLIKRVIGLPGDRVSAHGEDVYINGLELNEHWLPTVDQNKTDNFGPVTVPKGEYFVMGDNRKDSDDSRFIGDIPAKLIVGKAFIKIWPLSSITLY